MAFLIGGANTLEDDSYSISNSCRFNGSNTEMEDTLGTPTNIKKFTISLWFKRSALYANISTGQSLISCYRGAKSNPFGALNFGGNDEIEFFGFDDENTTVMNLQSSHGRFKDPSAWYHVVYAVDTTQSTDTNRVKIYVNGVQETSFSVSTYPSQNKDLAWNQSSTVHYIGHYQYTNATWMNGYEAEFAFIDGTQYAASNFGETNDNGVWVPKEFKDDVTFGNNGYYLEFKQTGTSQNSSGIGADTSGNDRHFAVSNLAAIDVTVDTPTNNFCTLNPLDNNEVPNGGNHIYAEGNTKFTATAGNNDTSVQGTNCTMAVANGKWYWEAEIDVVGPNYPGAGILAAESHKISSIQNGYAWNAAVSAYGYQYLADGQIGNSDSSTSSGWSAWNTAGKILMFALDMDNNKIYYGQNGTWDNSGDPTSGSTGTGAQSVNSSFSYFPHFHLRAYDGSTSPGVFLVNFGNPSFSISSGNSDANGYGNFEYAPPSGYYSLCTKNLAEFG